MTRITEHGALIEERTLRIVQTVVMILPDADRPKVTGRGGRQGNLVQIEALWKWERGDWVEPGMVQATLADTLADGTQGHPYSRKIHRQWDAANTWPDSIGEHVRATRPSATLTFT
jgi:hypothetical protein